MLIIWRNARGGAPLTPNTGHVRVRTTPRLGVATVTAAAPQLPRRLRVWLLGHEIMDIRRGRMAGMGLLMGLLYVGLLHVGLMAMRLTVI